MGTATVSTPVLPDPLTGPAFLVSNGAAAFPDLDIVLSGDGLRLMLHGQTNIAGGLTSATFPAIPDVPFSRFVLSLPQGPYSALTANGVLCGETLTMPTTLSAQNGKRISGGASISSTGCPGGAGAGGAISHLRIAPSRFIAAPRGASISAVSAPPRPKRGRRAKVTGANVSYVDAHAGVTTFLVLRRARGETRGRRCVARAPRRRHHGRACPLYVRLGSFLHRDVAGANSFHFTGRIGGRKLAAGSYRLQAGTAIPGGAKPASPGVSFTLKRG